MLGGVYMPGLDCQRARRFLADFLDGELSAPLSGDLESHLSGCQACRGELDSLRTLLELARDEKAFPVPEGFSKRLYAKVEALHQHEPSLVSQDVPVGITDETVPIGSHLIHFWQNQADFERGVRFLYPGLGKDEHCIIFGHTEALERVQEVLRDAGYDPEQLVRDRKLTVLKRHANASVTIAEIGAAIESALQGGARLVRFLGNLGLGTAPLPGGEDDVLDLEAKADALIRGLPAIIVCMYDISTVPGRLIFQGGLQTHDLTVCPNGIRQNPFYRASDDPHHVQ
jgi:DcmR-like sensory protein/putative zinc finger protein